MENTQTVTRFPRNKFGVTVNPVGECVALPWQGRKLLGEVVSVRRNDVLGMCFATVRHFNGEAWAIEPAVSSLEWIRQVPTSRLRDE